MIPETLRNMKRLREMRGRWEGVMKELFTSLNQTNKHTYGRKCFWRSRWSLKNLYVAMVDGVHLFGVLKMVSTWLNNDASNFFSVPCALLNMFSVDLLRSAMLSLIMFTCSIWVAGRAQMHKRFRSVTSEWGCKLTALNHQAFSLTIY